MSSGSFAGEGAAAHASSLGAKGAKRSLKSVATTAFTTKEADDRPSRTAERIRAVQEEVAPYDRNLFRSERSLKDSLGRLDSLWRDSRAEAASRSAEGVKAREAAAMTATARWMYNSALARAETRGMHKREDYPSLDAGQHYRLTSGGLDQVWVRPESVAQEEVTV